MFYRRLYYDLATGGFISSRMSQGGIYITDVADDFARLPELVGRTPDDTGLFEWLEPDAEIEDSFARATSVAVDVSGTEPQIVFDFTPAPSEPSDDQARIAALEAELAELRAAIERGLAQ